MSSADSSCRKDINTCCLSYVLSVFPSFYTVYKNLLVFTSQVVSYYFLYVLIITKNSDPQLWLHLGITWKALKTTDACSFPLLYPQYPDLISLVSKASRFSKAPWVILLGHQSWITTASERPSQLRIRWHSPIWASNCFTVLFFICFFSLWYNLGLKPGYIWTLLE